MDWSSLKAIEKFVSDIIKALFQKTILGKIAGCIFLLVILNVVIYYIIQILRGFPRSDIFKYNLPFSIMGLCAFITWYFVNDPTKKIFRLRNFRQFRVIVCVTTAAATAGISFCLIPYLQSKARDNLLVVIANFEPINEGAKSYSVEIPERLEGLIRDKKESGVPLEYPKRHREVIKGGDEKEKRENAKKIGKDKYGAHLVIWGSVGSTKTNGKEEFYFEPRITVANKLGSAILEKRQPEKVDVFLSEPEILKLRRRKIEETADIVSFIHGLALYKQRKQQKYEDAINVFKEIKNPDAEISFYHGTALLLLSRFEYALKQFDKAIKKKPQLTIAWNNKGVALDMLDKPEKALTCYDKAIEIDQQFALLWLNKGNALHGLGKHEEAITCYDKAIEIDPQFAPARSNKGFALHGLGKHEEAITCYDKAIEIDPQFAPAWFNKGSVLNNSGKHEEAITCYDKAIAINPQFTPAWLNKGNVLNNLGKHEEAITCYDKAIAINPQYPEALTNKGVTLWMLGKHEEALTCYDKAIEINPQLVNAWINKGVALVNFHKYEEAITSYDKAIEIDPQCPEALTGKGVVLGMLGKCEEAILCFDKAIEINTQDVEAWHNKGNALMILKRFPEAIEAYQNFIKFVSPQDAIGIRRAKERIRELQGKVKQK